RFLAPLVAQGVLIDGADASLHMLRACERRCQARALTTSLYQQLAHRLDLPHRYDLVIVPSGSFSLLIDANHARECLRRLFEHLLPGGRVVMEVEQYTGQLTGSGPWGGRWVDRPDGARILCSWLSRFNAAERISYGMGRYELIQNGRLLDTELEEFNLRFYEQDEFRSMLDAAGFANVQAHKAYGPDLPDSVDETLVFEAVRPAG
ncbi:MAG TPA: class I SAM-dependent methyltransferase, partial [Polyangiaceae bacterium]